MKIKLAYGEKGLVVNLPRRNLLKAIRNSLNRPFNSKPLRELASKKKNAVVVISDQTRPIPYKDILPPILENLMVSDLKREDISILIATGIHRPSTKKEIKDLVGEDISRKFNIINHFSGRKREHVYMGKTRRDAPVYIDRT